MDKKSSTLPIAVTTSSGMSGVSPSVSIMDVSLPNAQHHLVDGTQCDDSAVSMQNNAMPTVMADMKLNNTKTSYSLTSQPKSGKNFYLPHSTHSLVENFFDLLKNLRHSKTPLEAMAFQTEYNYKQTKAFFVQTSHLRRRYYRLFAPPTFYNEHR